MTISISSHPDQWTCGPGARSKLGVRYRLHWQRDYMSFHHEFLVKHSMYPPDYLAPAIEHMLKVLRQQGLL